MHLGTIYFENNVRKGTFFKQQNLDVFLKYKIEFKFKKIKTD